MGRGGGAGSAHCGAYVNVRIITLIVHSSILIIKCEYDFIPFFFLKPKYGMIRCGDGDLRDL